MPYAGLCTGAAVNGHYSFVQAVLDWTAVQDTLNHGFRIFLVGGVMGSMYSYVRIATTAVPTLYVKKKRERSCQGSNHRKIVQHYEYRQAARMYCSRSSTYYAAFRTHIRYPSSSTSSFVWVADDVHSLAVSTCFLRRVPLKCPVSTVAWVRYAYHSLPRKSVFSLEVSVHL